MQTEIKFLYTIFKLTKIKNLMLKYLHFCDKIVFYREWSDMFATLWTGEGENCQSSAPPPSVQWPPIVTQKRSSMIVW